MMVKNQMMILKSDGDSKSDGKSKPAKDSKE